MYRKNRIPVFIGKMSSMQQDNRQNAIEIKTDKETLASVTRKNMEIFVLHSEYHPGRSHIIFSTLGRCESQQSIQKSIIANFPKAFQKRLKTICNFYLLTFLSNIHIFNSTESVSL